MSGIYDMRDIPEDLRGYFVRAELGLEETPQAYVSEMVEVFREVRRVVRSDGTVWLNLGCSYASGGKSAIRSPQRQHVPACDTDGIKPQDSADADLACPDCGDESQGETPSRRVSSAHSGQFALQGETPLSPIGHDNEPLDCVEASPAAFPRAAQVSTSRALFQRDPVSCVPSGEASADLPSASTSSRGAPTFAHNSAGTSGTSALSGASAGRSQDTTVSATASKCSCGRCGICWANLAIPLLDLKVKDEINIPHLVALALQADGWFLRQTIIWAKPNPMPESVRDRCTKAHEYVFMLSKSARYWFDGGAIAEGTVSERDRGRPNGAQTFEKFGRNTSCGTSSDGTRNRRSVWTIATQPFSEAHFAVMAPELAETCIKAGCPEGGIVLDPFGGAGTTGLVADRLRRDAILIELNPDYAEIARNRISNDAGIFAEVAAE